MALIKMGGGILDARGSIGGQVFSRNRSGNYIRARTTPVNPQSSRQDNVRAIVSNLVAEWSQTLTAAQRAAWGDYADNIQVTNKLGEPIKLTGFNHFIRSNSVILLAGGTQVADGPTELFLPEVDQAFAPIGYPSDPIGLTFDDTAEWCDEDDAFMVVFASQGKPAGRNFIGGPFRYCGRIAGDSVTPPSSTDTSLSTPWTWAVGQNVRFYHRIVRADGRVSTKGYHTHAVEADS